MISALQLPSIRNAKAFQLTRWSEVCADPAMHRVPGRIETNRFGQVIMMPPPGFTHSCYQSSLNRILAGFMTSGRTLTECAVLTSDGVRGVDVAWISATRIKRGLKNEVLTLAPEICIEVISPGNTRQEMEDKRQLYFAAGADEVWLCDQQGRLHFYLKNQPSKPATSSSLCSQMPRQITI